MAQACSCKGQLCSATAAAGAERVERALQGTCESDCLQSHMDTYGGLWRKRCAAASRGHDDFVCQRLGGTLATAQPRGLALLKDCVYLS